jgi:hypothetical protein
MPATMPTLLFMLAVLAAVAVTAKRLNVPPSPQLMLLVILPPLISSAGFAMSWRGGWI